MTRPLPYVNTATTGLFSHADALGITAPNAFVDALEASASRPFHALETLSTAQLNIDKLRDYLITELRSRDIPWNKIAQALGTSPQNAHKKYRHLDPATR